MLIFNHGTQEWIDAFEAIIAKEESANASRCTIEKDQDGLFCIVERKKGQGEQGTLIWKYRGNTEEDLKEEVIEQNDLPDNTSTLEMIRDLAIEAVEDYAAAKDNGEGGENFLRLAREYLDILEKYQDQ